MMQTNFHNVESSWNRYPTYDYTLACNRAPKVFDMCICGVDNGSMPTLNSSISTRKVMNNTQFNELCKLRRKWFEVMENEYTISKKISKLQVTEKDFSQVHNIQELKDRLSQLSKEGDDAFQELYQYLCKVYEVSEDELLVPETFYNWVIVVNGRMSPYTQSQRLEDFQVACYNFP